MVRADPIRTREAYTANKKNKVLINEMYHKIMKDDKPQKICKIGFL